MFQVREGAEVRRHRQMRYSALHGWRKARSFPLLRKGPVRYNVVDVIVLLLSTQQIYLVVNRSQATHISPASPRSRRAAPTRPTTRPPISTTSTALSPTSSHSSLAENTSMHLRPTHHGGRFRPVEHDHHRRVLSIPLINPLLPTFPLTSQIHSPKENAVRARLARDVASRNVMKVDRRSTLAELSL